MATVLLGKEARAIRAVSAGMALSLSNESDVGISLAGGAGTSSGTETYGKELRLADQIRPVSRQGSHTLTTSAGGTAPITALIGPVLAQSGVLSAELWPRSFIKLCR